MTAQALSPAFSLRVTFPRVIRSEWVKLRTLRSTYITLAVTLVLFIGISALVCGVRAAHWPPRDPHDALTFNPVFTSLIGVQFAQLSVGVLGVLMFSGEYSTGMIRATLTAVPKRLPVLGAKLLVFSAVIAVISLVSSFAAFFAGQSLLSAKHIQTTLSAPGVTREVIGAALYVVVVAVLAVALGAILRSTAGGISCLVGLFFVLPPIMDVLPTSWSNTIGPYLPQAAGQALWARPDGAHLAPWAGFGVFCAWAAAAVLLAAVALLRRDA
jgi:ABC-type transport system involved in multi-copper enzyme maturation permease subunit